MQCPVCESEIGKARYCGCGWKQPDKKKKSDAPLTPCAHETCARLAIVKIKTKLGWANLCEDHYDEHYTTKALKTCEELGLDTISKKRAWVKENVGKLQLKMKPFYMREPGEDEEFTYQQS